MENKKILQNLQIYNVDKQTFSETTDILIENGVIGKIDYVPLEDHHTAEVFDCSEKYALPGLFESHAHLALLSVLKPENKKWVLQSFLDKGITQIRDVGGPLDFLKRLTQEISTGKLKGPDIFYSGPMLEKSPLTWKRNNEVFPGFTTSVNTIEDAEQIITTLVDQDATFVKTFNKFDREVFEYLFQRAKESDLRFTLDPGSPFFPSISIRLGLELGVNCFEHASHILSSVLVDDLEKEQVFPDNSQEQKDSFVKKILQQGTNSIDKTKLTHLLSTMVENDSYYCLTLAVFHPEKGIDFSKPETVADSSLSKEEKKYYPAIMNDLKNAFKDIQEDEDARKRRYGTFTKAEDVYPFLKLFTQHMAKANVKLLAGHDGFSPIRTILELELLKEYGFSPAQVLNSATLYPAAWLGIEDQYGSLTKKKKANILIVNDNPLSDIQNIKKVHLVFKDGTVVYQEP